MRGKYLNVFEEYSEEERLRDRKGNSLLPTVSPWEVDLKGGGGLESIPPTRKNGGLLSCSCSTPISLSSSDTNIPVHTLLHWSHFQCWHHKVLTSAEYRAVSGVFQNIDPPPPSPPSECTPPAPKAVGGGGYTFAGGWGGGGSNISEDARHWIGLLQYISLRLTLNSYFYFRKCFHEFYVNKFSNRFATLLIS